MKPILRLLSITLVLALSAQAQIKLRLQSDDVVEPGFLTSANANVLLGGLNNATTGSLNAARGGTGQTSYNTGDIIYANGPAALARLPAAQGLLSGGATPAWLNTSAAIATALLDETGSGGGGKLMFSQEPEFTNFVSGAGAWYNGNSIPRRAFIGMAPTSDSVLRIYSSSAGVDSLSINLANHDVNFTGPLRIQDGTSAATSVRFSGGQGIYNRDNANKTISFGTGGGGNPVFEVVTQTGQVNFGTSGWLFSSFADARNNREKLGLVTRYASVNQTTSDHETVIMDNALSVPMEAGAVWDFEFWVPMATEDNVMNMRTGIIVSQTPQYMRWNMEVWHTSLLLRTGLSGSPNVFATTGLSPGQEYLVIIRGTILAHASLASNISYAFMQNADSAANLVRVRGGRAIGTRLN